MCRRRTEIIFKVDQWELTYEEIVDDTLFENNVFPFLNNLVFHKTNQRAYEGICKSGVIKNNRDKKYPFSYHRSDISYGRNKGNVCLFDFRDVALFEINETLLRYSFLPSYQDNYIVYFFHLAETYFTELIPVSVANAEADYKKMWIPYTECWFPGDIPIEHISHVTKVFIKDEN